MTSADLDEQIFAIWERMACGWEQRREAIWEVSELVGRELVDAVDPQPGEAILELAAGLGDTGFLAAERVGAGGHVISSDFSPAMVDAARRRGQELDVENVEYRVLDAQAIGLPDASVGGVICRWGYMLMPDPDAALRETRRVLKRGGRLAFSVWAGPAENPWAATVSQVLVAAGHLDPPQPDQPGIFALADTVRIEALLTAAGFEPPRIVEVPVLWRYESFEDYWTFTLELAGALAMVIERLSDEDRESVRSMARERLGSQSDGSLELPGLCLNAFTRSPAVTGA